MIATASEGGAGRFVAAGDLEPGMQLRLGDGSPAYVTGVEATGIIEPVYNFSVDGWKTYHVGELGVWVHNDNCLHFLKNLYNKGPELTYSGLPKYAELDVGGGRIFIAPGGTKHFEEDAFGLIRNGISPMAARSRAQAEFEELNQVLRSIGPNPPVTNRAFPESGWELRFGAPREAGQLPVLFHARRLPS